MFDVPCPGELGEIYLAGAGKWESSVHAVVIDASGDDDVVAPKFQPLLSYALATAYAH